MGISKHCCNEIYTARKFSLMIFLQHQHWAAAVAIMAAVLFSEAELSM